MKSNKPRLCVYTLILYHGQAAFDVWLSLFKQTAVFVFSVSVHVCTI